MITLTTHFNNKAHVLMTRLSLVAFAALFAFIGTANGQGGGRADVASTQVNLGTGQPTVEVNGHAPPSPNDADLGEQAILKRSEGYRPFVATASIPVYYTSNVALTRSHEQNDWLEAPIVGQPISRS